MSRLLRASSGLLLALLSLSRAASAGPPETIEGVYDSGRVEHRPEKIYLESKMAQHYCSEPGASGGEAARGRALHGLGRILQEDRCARLGRLFIAQPTTRLSRLQGKRERVDERLSGAARPGRQERLRAEAAALDEKITALDGLMRRHYAQLLADLRPPQGEEQRLDVTAAEGEETSPDHP